MKRDAKLGRTVVLDHVPNVPWPYAESVVEWWTARSLFNDGEVEARCMRMASDPDAHNRAFAHIA